MPTLRMSAVTGLAALVAAGGFQLGPVAEPGRSGLARPDMIPIVITLAEQADLTNVSGQGLAHRRRNLIVRLRATAAATQPGLRRELGELVRQGRAERPQYFWLFNGIAARVTPDAIQELAARSDVRSITLDAPIPAPPELTGGPPEPNLAAVNAPTLWNLGYRGQGVVVANMDTGVDVNHPDLAAQWRGGSNSWFDPNGQHPTTPADVNGHGTWTMGVMVGRDAGGTAVGMAPDARWIAVKIFNDSGIATSSGIHAGFQWLLDPDGDPASDDAADVVNNSWAAGTPGCDLSFQLDLQALRSAGVLPIFSAGNYGPAGSTSASPANNPEAFAVGAIDDANAVWPDSSRGPSACGEPASTYPELVAPGVSIHTTDLFGMYADVSGTSIAAPHAAGGLALLLGAFPGLSAEQQQAALIAGASDLGSPGADNDYGYGRLDILGAYSWLATQPDFGVTATPATAATTAGGSAGYTVQVTPSNGFDGAVALSLSGLPAGQASWTFSPDVVPGGSGLAQLEVTTASSLAPGSYPLTISASSGTLVHSAPITLVVNPPPDFGLTISPTSRTVKRGSATTYLVSVSAAGGFTGTVSLSVTGLPPQATATFTPASVVVPGTSTLSVTTANRAGRGTFTLTVIGQSGSLIHQATATLIVK